MRSGWLWTLLLPFYGIAQSNQLRSITVADGLSQGMIFDMVQDKEGFLWIATKNGLNRYDGYNYKVYNANREIPYSISEGQVTSLCEDNQGRIWIGTYSKGINLFDRHTQKFYHASFKTVSALDSTRTVINPSVKTILQSPDGGIWIGATNGQILRITLSDSLLQGFPTQEDFSSMMTTTTVANFGETTTDGGRVISLSANKKWIWLFVGSQVYKLDYAIGNISRLTAMPAKNLDIKGVWDIRERPDGSWVVCKGDSVFIVQNNVAKLAYAQPKPNINYWHLDKDCTIWVNTGDSLYHWPVGQAEKRQAIFSPAHANEFFIRSLIDRQENIWLGTNGFGIKKWLPAQRKFSHILAGNSIWHVYEDRQGRIFLWDFVYCYLLNKANGGKTDLLPRYKNNNKGKMTQARNGDFWWVMRKDAEQKHMLLVHLDSNLNTIKEYDLQKPAYFQRTHVLEDKEGFIWIGGANSCLTRFNPKNEQIQDFDYSQFIAKTEVINGVISMYEDGQGIIWVGTEEGLLKVSQKNGLASFDYFRNNPADIFSLPNNYITGVTDDPWQPDNYLWIATHGGGLCRLDKKTRQMRHFTEKEGLLNNNVVGILTDKQKNIWISTYRGLSMLNPKSGTFIHYSEKDGLQSDEFNTAVFFKNQQGKLYFGGINGLNIFEPAADWQSIAPENVRIIGFKLNNEEVNPAEEGSVLTQSVEYLPPLSLRHNQNQLTFEFSTLDLNNASKSRYRYQMVGIDKDWVEAGTNRFANYAQLPPGRYTLKVIASLDGAQWTAKPTELSIVIHPPWYQSWWAYLVYALVLCSILYWAYSVQIRRVRLQEQVAYKQLEADKLLELDQIKTQFFTNISHEFRTPLTLILGPVEDLGKDYPQDGRLQTLKRNAHRLLALINQLLDLGKLDAREMKVNLQKQDMVQFVQVLAGSFAELAASRGVQFSVIQNLQQAPVFFDSDKLEKIIGNLLSNAFKFTPAGKSVHLNVVYNKPTSSVAITVKDEGVGIAAGELDKIFNRFYQTLGNKSYGGTGIGLSLVKELASILKGEITVESTLGSGTSFTVQLPLSATTESSPIQLDYSIRLADDAAVAINKGKAVESAIQEGNSSENILLIVEDDDDLRAYIKSVFEKSYTILEAKDGQDGYEQAMEAIPDIIISDLMMPRMDGIEFCRLVKTTEKTSHIPVILLTAKASNESRIEGLTIGADDYVTKPFHSDEISLRVRNMLQTREQWRQLYGKQMLAPKPTIPVASPMDEAFLEKVNGLMEKNLSDYTFDIVTFAKEMSMTPSQLRRKLKAVTNYNPTEFVRRYRLRKAADLLAGKTGNVSETAFAVGFESLSYFSKAFQEEFGVVPSEFVGQTV